MPALHRKGDIGSGHGCYTPRPNIQGSPNVFTNNISNHRVGDAWAVHCCPGNGCHDGTMAEGSPNVFTNNKAQARIGDDVDCGSVAAQGSPNVFVNS